MAKRSAGIIRQSNLLNSTFERFLFPHFPHFVLTEKGRGKVTRFREKKWGKIGQKSSFTSFQGLKLSFTLRKVSNKAEKKTVEGAFLTF